MWEEQAGTAIPQARDSQFARLKRTLTGKAVGQSASDGGRCAKLAPVTRPASNEDRKFHRVTRLAAITDRMASGGQRHRRSAPPPKARSASLSQRASIESSAVLSSSQAGRELLASRAAPLICVPSTQRDQTVRGRGHIRDRPVGQAASAPRSAYIPAPPASARPSPQALSGASRHARSPRRQLRSSRRST